MNKRRQWVWALLAALLVVPLAAWALGARSAAEPVRAQVIGAPVTQPEGAFERAFEPRALVFPRDHGPHPDFQTEWWYYTGNLAAEDGRRFGYQLTFFRRAVLPPEDRPERASGWAAEQIYLAHFTLTDVQNRQFRAFERYERGAAGLAGAAGEPLYGVWLHDWTVEQLGPDTYRLHAAEGPVALDLQLVDSKGPVLQGNQGLSQKGPEPGNASLYYSQTRLKSSGTVRVDGRVYAVEGWSWLDREISTSALGKGQVGWDWFALQLDDNSELMVYMLRRSDGTVDAFSKGSLIRPDGTVVPLKQADFQIRPEDTWTSSHSGGIYPSRWTVQVPGEDMTLTVTPLLADQELNVSFIYWEGAVRVEGARAGQPVAGYGYVELTGYAESLEGDV